MSSKSSSFIDTSLVDDFYPIRSPLSAKFKKSFAYKTIGYRLPVILTKIIDHLSRDKNEIGEKFGLEARAEVKVIVGNLAKLKNELQTNKSVTPVESVVWNDYMSQIAEKFHNGILSEVTFYLSPWLFIECYMYRRIFEAFDSTFHLKQYDYCQKQKRESFFDSLEQICTIADFTLSSKRIAENLQSLLEISLWGNRCDLSLSAGELNSQTIHLLDHLKILKPSILCDDSDQVWKFLEKGNNETPKSIGYILDNSGFELFTDFCLAHVLMTEVAHIDFFVKQIPWFISDATSHDIEWLLDTMYSHSNAALHNLAQTWKENFQTNRWKIIVSEFWTLPHTFNEMKLADANLYSLLGTNTLLIFKGDLNYRKLVGDINWQPETPFKETLRGFLPSPLVAIRTCKADTVSGLRPGLGEEMKAKDSEWLTTGEYGLIQFTS